MVALVDKSRCTGCAVCSAVCQRAAISMVADVEGFYYPWINSKLCVECGECMRSCPVMAEGSEMACLKCYAAKHANHEVVVESSSGGVFSALADYVLKNGGVVFGAAYDQKTFEVSHVEIDNASKLWRLRGSKYVQSDIGDSYRNVKRALSERKKVLFSGTPCQVAALKSFLKKDCENLLLVDLICHGVPSAKLFDVLKSELERAHGTLHGLSFRDKTEGWRSRAVTGWYEGDRKIRELGRLNDYLRAFINHLTLRHSCESCKFNAGRSGADITLGDFWGVEKVLPEFDDNAGVSAVILHTRKGVETFERLDCLKRPVDLSDIAVNNPSYSAKRGASPNRNKFMRLVYEAGISAAYQKCCGQSLWSRAKARVCRALKDLL